MAHWAGWRQMGRGAPSRMVDVVRELADLFKKTIAFEAIVECPLPTVNESRKRLLARFSLFRLSLLSTHCRHSV